MKLQIISRLSPWSHFIGFLAILVAAIFLESVLRRFGWVAPPLAAWEIAALVHVFFVALSLVQFRGFQFATKRFNSLIPKLILFVVILAIVLKLFVIILESKVVQGNSYVPVTTFDSPISLAHFISPYIMVVPLFFFFFINCLAWNHVRRHSNTLGMYSTDQERYLVGLIRFVDLPVILTFSVMVLYLKAVGEAGAPKYDENYIVGIIGCSLLVVSNIMTGIFDQSWSDNSRGL